MPPTPPGSSADSGAAAKRRRGALRKAPHMKVYAPFRIPGCNGEATGVYMRSCIHPGFCALSDGEVQGGGGA